ncbi:MAG TPA: hypothetical protein VNR20_07025 [Terriglobales bacterium]|nr:hypothetical protein [Terriglobales bacterium]
MTLALAAPTWGQLPPNVAKNAKAASAAANTRPAKRYYGKSKPPAAKQAPAPEPQPTPAQPVVPLRPSQMPSVPPRVSFQQGQLTVIAENSTLGDIFGAIRNATGIKIESQGGPSGDRVAAKIGPAPAKEVLLSLLQGSRYDYVMLGSLTDPELVERVILTPKTAGGTQTASAPAPQMPPQQARPETEDENNDENAEEDTGPPPVRGPDRPQPEQPGAAVQPAPNTQVQPQVQPQYPQNPPMNPNPNGQVKTPEQLLQELRERQQQQQQQQADPNRPR